jgi:hypothetical protein
VKSAWHLNGYRPVARSETRVLDFSTRRKFHEDSRPQCACHISHSDFNCFLIALAGSQGGATLGGVPIFAIVVGLAFLIQWLAFIPRLPVSDRKIL